MPEQQTFYLHYWPEMPIYVCLRDLRKRAFDGTDGAFKSLSDVQDPARVCIGAVGRLDCRADYGCSYSVQIDLSRVVAKDGSATGITEGDRLEVFWLAQSGDSPSPNEDEVITSGRLVLSGGQFEPVDTCSGKMLDEETLFAEKRQREEDYQRFRESEQQWQAAVYARLDDAVKAADVGEVLRVLADDLCHWGGDLKNNLCHYCSQRTGDEMVRSLMGLAAQAPVEIQVPWIVRDLAGCHESFELLEFHKNREYAQCYADRFNAFDQERRGFSRMVVEYTARYGRDLILEPFLVLDERRKDLRVHASRLAEHLLVIASQFAKNAVGKRDAQPITPSGNDVQTTGRIDRQRLLPKHDIPATLEEAVDHLLFVLERHRLLFLYFAGACRINPRASQRVHGVQEIVSIDEIGGWDDLLHNIDSEGTFLFRYRVVLDRFAQAAVCKFGSGKGRKPLVPSPDGHGVEVEGGSLPYWSIDAEGANYLEESSDAMMGACMHLRTLDTQCACGSVTELALATAHDNSQPRWYASNGIRWEYLSQLDEALLALKHAKVALCTRRQETDARPSRIAGQAKAASSVDTPAGTASRGGTPGKPGNESAPMKDAETQSALTIGMATIIMGCKALQALTEIKQFYPHVIGDDEACQIHHTLAETIESWLAISDDSMKGCRETYTRSTPENAFTEEILMFMTATAMMATNSEEPESDGKLEQVFQQSQQMAAEPVRSIVKRLVEAMVFDCRIVEPTAGPEYANPQRALYLLGEYWAVLRSASITASQEMLYHVPHPLTPILVNLRDRINGCFTQLKDVNGADNTKEAIEWFLSCLLAGDTIELQAVEEYFNRKLTEVEVFIQEAKLLIGRRTFHLTSAETAFLKVARDGADQYEHDTKTQEKAVQRYLNGPEFAALRKARRMTAKSNAARETVPTECGDGPSDTANGEDDLAGASGQTPEGVDVKLAKPRRGLDDSTCDPFLSHIDIARTFGRNPEATRKALGRWRQKNCDGWHEVDNRKMNEPKYLYRLSAVRSLFESQPSGHVSGDRPTG